MKKITEDKKNDIRNALKSGMVGIEVADRTGVSISTVNKIRKELEVEGFDIWHVPGHISASLY